MGWGWQRAIDAAKRHGVKNYRLEIDSPATRKEVDEVECAIARTLPELFRQTLLEFSRRVDFFWFLPEHVRPPKPLAGVFCGECSWDLGRIAAMYDEARWLASNAFVEDTPDERLWQDKLPFHDIGNGDFIAIDVSSSEPQPIVYLATNWLSAMDTCWELISLISWIAGRQSAVPMMTSGPSLLPERVKCIDLEHPNVALVLVGSAQLVRASSRSREAAGVVNRDR